MWLADHLPDTNVWSLEYGAHRTFWRGAKMTISDHATLSLEILATKQLGRRPLFFVTHSLGGIVVKAILRASALSTHSGIARIANATRAVTFFATPNNGSWTASQIVELLGHLGPFARLFRLSYIVQELQYNNPQLKDLNDWYKSFVQQRGPGLRTANKVYFETKGLFGNFYPIVSRESADPGIPDTALIPVPTNHIRICKFDTTRNIMYESALVFLKEHLAAFRPPDEVPRRSNETASIATNPLSSNTGASLSEVDAAIRVLQNLGRISTVEVDGRKRMLIDETDSGESADVNRTAHTMLNAALEPTLKRAD